MSDFVSAVLQCAQTGLTTDAIDLELQFHNSENRLTSSDHHYRKQWILAIFMTRALYFKGVAESNEEVLGRWKTDHAALASVVWVIWRGLLSQDRSSMVQFDRALATKGMCKMHVFVFAYMRTCACTFVRFVRRSGN